MGAGSRILLVFAALSLLCPLVLADDIFEYKSLSLDLTISNNFSIIAGDHGYIDKLTARLSWYPSTDYRQKVDEIITSPQAEFVDNEGFLFTWDKPDGWDYSVEQQSTVTTTSYLVPVKKKIAFPIKNLDSELAIYLSEQEIIDINQNISSLASSLAQGEDDLYKVVVKLAGWVEDNVDYNLSSVTAEASQKSSWVLQNRRGVCDELTSLFISMARSLGIPARFVSGLSYSNVGLQNDDWGPHGWAEVYIPGSGWVPFDVTYKELGYVDATHIKLKESLDAKDSSVDYSSLGRDIRIMPGSLDFNVKIKGKGAFQQPLLRINSSIREGLVGFGSYNLLRINLFNPNDFYVSERLSLVGVNSLEVIGGHDKLVVLAPQETKSLFWMLKPEVNDGDYIYTFPLKVISELGSEADTSFKVGSRYKIFSEEYMQSFIQAERVLKPYSENLDLACQPDRKELYSKESVRLDCTVRSTVDLGSVKVCLEKNCSSIDLLKKNVPKNFTYNLKFDTLGVKTLQFKAESAFAYKILYQVIDVQDKPMIEILNVTYPERMHFDDEGQIVFTLRRESSSIPRNVTVTLSHELFEETWIFEQLDTDYQVRFVFKGSSLMADSNEITLRLDYVDRMGERYSQEEIIKFDLEGANFMQRVRIFFNWVDKKIADWFSGLASAMTSNI